MARLGLLADFAMTLKVDVGWKRVEAPPCKNSFNQILQLLYVFSEAGHDLTPLDFAALLASPHFSPEVRFGGLICGFEWRGAFREA